MGHLKGKRCKTLIFLFKLSLVAIFVYGFITSPGFAETVLQCCGGMTACVHVFVYALSGDPVAHFSDRSSASVSLSVFQERPHVSPCAASLVARWREGERCAVCVPPASTWPLTTRPVKVTLLQKHPSAYRYGELL